MLLAYQEFCLESKNLSQLFIVKTSLIWQKGSGSFANVGAQFNFFLCFGQFLTNSQNSFILWKLMKIANSSKCGCAVGCTLCAPAFPILEKIINTDCIGCKILIWSLPTPFLKCLFFFVFNTVNIISYNNCVGQWNYLLIKAKIFAHFLLS